MNRRSILWVSIVLVVFAALTRILLYPNNFSPIIALALFSGACLPDKRYSFALPLMAMFVSDILFEVLNIAPGFWGSGQVVNYLILLVVTLFGTSIKKISFLPVATATLTSSFIFFLLSNSSVWIFDHSYYTPSFSGWLDCIIAGIPFLKNGIFADLFYAAIFFGSYYFIFEKQNQRATI